MAEWFGFKFLRNTPKEDLKSFVPPSDEGNTIINDGNAAAAYITHTYDLDNLYKTEADLVQRYRELSLHAEVDSAIQEIVNEVVSEDEVGDIVGLDLSECELDDRVKDKIRDEFQTVVNLFDFNTNGSDIFRKWYVDGKIYFHPVIDSKNPKLGIRELRQIDPTQIKKVNEVVSNKDPRTGVDLLTSKESFYVFNPNTGTTLGSGVKVAEDSIIHASSGISDATTGLTLSFLHKAIRPANQLRMLEDANIIYFLSRAPMRRMFYIDTGTLPNHKAEQYVNEIMNKYRNKIVYDSKTGEVKDTKNILSMLEDFWLPRREGSKGTEIQTLEGAQGLNQQLESMEYFKKKLFTSLNIPISRLDQANQFNVGRATEITRDEIKFAKFTEVLRRRFADIFLQALRIQVLFRGIMTIEDWEEYAPMFHIIFTKDNHFSSLKELDVLATRLDILEKISGHIGKHYSSGWVDRHVLGLTDDEINEMREEMKAEKEDPDVATDEPGGDDMGMGGDFGGGDMGGDFDGADFEPSDEEDFGDMEPEDDLSTPDEPETPGAPQ